MTGEQMLKDRLKRKRVISGKGRSKKKKGPGFRFPPKNKAQSALFLLPVTAFTAVSRTRSEIIKKKMKAIQL